MPIENTRIRTSSQHNFKANKREWEKERNKAMLKAVKALVLEWVIKMRQGRDVLGRTQRQNQPGRYREGKALESGHTTPLIGYIKRTKGGGVRDGRRILSDPNDWRINGISATSGGLKPAKRYVISPPIRRHDAIKGLVQRRYRVPGIVPPLVSRSFERRFQGLLGRAFTTAERRISRRPERG